MDSYLAILIVQQKMRATHCEKVEAWQLLLDLGLIWHLPDKDGRSCGREAARLLHAGVLKERHPIAIAAE